MARADWYLEGRFWPQSAQEIFKGPRQEATQDSGVLSPEEGLGLGGGGRSDCRAGVGTRGEPAGGADGQRKAQERQDRVAQSQRV